MNPFATPALVVDVDVLNTNIDAMAARAAQVGATLRPHVKTHKCLPIARRQLDAGATGITVATVGEAEVFVAAGFDDVFIAYPLWLDDARGARLAHLASKARVRVGCDSVAAAEQVRRTTRGADLEIVIEVDSGHHRSGVRPDSAGELAAAIVGLGLPVIGVFTFPGHSYAPDRLASSAEDERLALAGAAASLTAGGVVSRVISGGSSPSLPHARQGVISELRPGAYVFNDAQQWELGVCTQDQIALTVHATVVSHAGGRAVLDAGSKALAADRAPYASGYGRLLDHPDARIVILSEHHAVVEMGGALPALGSVVRVVPNHCCNAVNLADEVVVVRDGRRIDAWPIAARGANT